MYRVCAETLFDFLAKAENKSEPVAINARLASLPFNAVTGLSLLDAK